MRGLGLVALDEDDNIVSCPFCEATVFIDRLAREDQQFPMGKLDASPGVKRILGFNTDTNDPLAWMSVGAKYVELHLRGDVGAAQMDQDPDDGSMFSAWNHLGDVIWITTNPQRTITRLTTPEEYVAESRGRSAG
jgi:hypothetical protein